MNNQIIKDKEKSEIKEVFGNFKNLLEKELQDFEEALDKETRLTKKRLKNIDMDEITKISELFESVLMKNINNILIKNNIFFYQWEGTFNEISILKEEYSELKKIFKTLNK